MLAICLVAVLCAATTAPAQIFSALHTFSPASVFEAPLVPGPDDTLFGVSCEGGLAGKGTVFKAQPDGKGFGIIYSFTCLEILIGVPSTLGSDRNEL